VFVRPRGEVLGRLSSIAGVVGAPAAVDGWARFAIIFPLWTIPMACDGGSSGVGRLDCDLLPCGFSAIASLAKVGYQTHRGV
jgi:hypothetical protein